MLPEVKFYLLTDKTIDRWLFSCHLVEKLYKASRQVFIYCNNQQDAFYIDELLWTYKDESFIPHNLQGEGPEPPPKIQIGYQQDAGNFNDVLLNFHDEVPDFFKKFKSIIEIVAENEESKVLGREHYRTYQSKKIKPQTAKHASYIFDIELAKASYPHSAKLVY